MRYFGAVASISPRLAFTGCHNNRLDEIHAIIRLTQANLLVCLLACLLCLFALLGWVEQFSLKVNLHPLEDH
jgi:hypothetical protein